MENVVLENVVLEIQSRILQEFGSGAEAENVDTAREDVGSAVELKANVCYIVAAVIFNEEGRVLMMREAKESCRGKWYLPAGRMERNESIEEGVIRETVEETGLLIRPLALLCIESQSTCWFRFTFAGKSFNNVAKISQNYKLATG